MLRKRKRSNEVDFLRGLAIIGVVAVHCNQFVSSNYKIIDIMFSYGRFGVQAFFILSGFIMCKLYCYNLSTRNEIKIFYIKRFFTLVPIYWFFIIIFLFVFYFLKINNKVEAKEILLSFLFIDYLHPKTFFGIVTGGWSIAAELYFYIFFPFLIFLLKKDSKSYLILAIFFNLLYNLIIRKLLYQHYSSDLSLNIDLINIYLDLNFANQISFFILGCYIFFSKKKLGALDISLILCWLFLSIYLFYNFVISDKYLYYVILQIILLCIIKFTIKFNLYIKFISKIGKESYGIYLVHYIIIYTLYGFWITKSTNIYQLFFLFLLSTIFSYYLTKLILNILIKKTDILKKKILSKI